MQDFLLPSKTKFERGETKNEATVTIEPCYPGYGTTLGNALRRVLLSSLPGAAVTAIKIKGAEHEFCTLPYLKEDIIEVILNLKQLRLKVFSNETVKLNLKVSGEKKVLAEDITPSSEVEISNPKLPIATLTNKAAELDMKILVSQGRGYITTEMQDKKNLELGTIIIDSIFTPIQKVGFKVENVRVGQMTNYDKLILNIITDGTITPEEAIKQSAKILIDHFKLVGGLEEESEKINLKEEPKNDTLKKDSPEIEKEESNEENHSELLEKTKKKRGRPSKKK